MSKGKVFIYLIIIIALLFYISYSMFNAGYKKGMSDIGKVLCTPYDVGYDHSINEYVCYDGVNHFKPNLTFEVGTW